MGEDGHQQQISFNLNSGFKGFFLFPVEMYLVGPDAVKSHVVICCQEPV